jgi:guanylate kinase
MVMVLVTGVSKTGKRTLAGNLLALRGFRMLTCDTSREPQEGDLPGEYNHVENDVVYGSQYAVTSWSAGARHGVPKREVMQAIADEAAKYVLILTPNLVGELYEVVGKERGMEKTRQILPLFLCSPDIDSQRQRLAACGQLSKLQIQGRVEDDTMLEQEARRSSIPYRIIPPCSIYETLDAALAHIAEVFEPVGSS